MNILEDKNISKHYNDIIQKAACTVLKDATLEFYGIKTAKIKELLNVELPKIEVGNTAADLVFLLEDNKILHIEFQTKYSKKDLRRFMEYDMRISNREDREVITVIIYSCDVKDIELPFVIGCLKYEPKVIMMKDYDGNEVLVEIEEKIKSNQELSKLEILKAILFPMMTHDLEKAEAAKRIIEISSHVPDVQYAKSD